MILYVTYPVPDGLCPDEMRGMVDDCEVRDPASGVVGKAIHAVCSWRDGRAELRLTLELDDASAVAAATRAGQVF